MSTLLQKIATQQSQLENHIFCQHLLHHKDISLNAYGFVPHMTFFVLGFRDILEEIRVKNPKTELEISLNAHCDEDSEHWLWFIEDLKVLNMDVNYWGGDISSVLSSLWSRKNHPIRKMVYDVVCHIRSTKTADEKMIIIDCLESAFSVFINSLNSITHRNGYYEKLKYFGSQHYEDEASHSTGNWLEGEKSSDHSHLYEIQPFRVRHMSYVVDEIFSGFNQVFDCWYDSLKNVDSVNVNIAI
jgi:hypothetical protein